MGKILRTKMNRVFNAGTISAALAVAAAVAAFLTVVVAAFVVAAVISLIVSAPVTVCAATGPVSIPVTQVFTTGDSVTADSVNGASIGNGNGGGDYYPLPFTNRPTTITKDIDLYTVYKIAEPKIDIVPNGISEDLRGTAALPMIAVLIILAGLAAVNGYNNPGDTAEKSKSKIEENS